MSVLRRFASLRSFLREGDDDFRVVGARLDGFGEQLDGANGGLEFVRNVDGEVAAHLLRGLLLREVVDERERKFIVDNADARMQDPARREHAALDLDVLFHDLAVSPRALREASQLGMQGAVRARDPQRERRVVAVRAAPVAAHDHGPGRQNREHLTSTRGNEGANGRAGARTPAAGPQPRA